MPCHGFDSPLGPLRVTEEGGAIIALNWGMPSAGTPTLMKTPPTPLLQRAEQQVLAYCQGARQVFDLPLAPGGTAFQQRVWAALCAIPFGVLCSYGALATALATAPRAIGGACARNPIPILIPCHRVIATGGRLGGYSGHQGLETKRRLLALEGVALEGDSCGGESLRPF
ncbi:MAG: methylated-DNA-protein-cysteine S-methyltransferase [Rhodospirillaceae bacterium]|nr:MAG: methylated-DNA-protein-cysteine S-methyltransferase [Rhodospirillaceae bacterium]